MYLDTDIGQYACFQSIILWVAIHPKNPSTGDCRRVSSSSHDRATCESGVDLRQIGFVAISLSYLGNAIFCGNLPIDTNTKKAHMCGGIEPLSQISGYSGTIVPNYD